MTRTAKRHRQSRVPAGRFERLARFGVLAGEIALGSLAAGVRRVTGVDPVARAMVLTEANARRLARRLSGLRGAALKIGQMLSLQGEDLLPPEVTRALAIVRADADAMPHAQLRRVLGQAYGAGWARRFREFDLAPVAAASIGQVHRAVALDGRDLALKIQYPGVARSIESDVDNVATVLRLARDLPEDFDLTALLAEAKRHLRRETDYLVEAVLLERYRQLVDDDPELVVPRVHADLTTSRVLAMDYVDGVPLADLCDGGHPQALRDRLARRLYRLLFRELFEFRFFNSDPNFANYLYLPESGQLGLLDFGGVRELSPDLSASYARLFRAGMTGDRGALQAAMQHIGFFPADEPGDRVTALIDLFLIGCEPFRHRGAYDFAASGLPVRARTAGFELTFRRGFHRPPPPDTVFLHRKLAGMFLLCAQLGARIDVRTLLQPLLDGAPDVSTIVERA